MITYEGAKQKARSAGYIVLDEDKITKSSVWLSSGGILHIYERPDGRGAALDLLDSYIQP